MDLKGVLQTFGYLFYVVSPKETSFEKVEDVPDYTMQVLPCFLFLVVLEKILLRLRNNPMRINDMYGSISQGVFSETIRILMESWKMASYIYIYSNWRVVNLPWDSLWTWFLAFVTVDFIYYWAHRASHEINFLWSAHQVHHSSEDYNLTTALRQSVLQSYFLWMLYLPLALIVPPTAFIVHMQFNLLFQFWIHTELIQSLGPLEYILNTPSHHRVHHGRNRYCIDKNYAGALIIWDRMFGTFEPENEEVVYGLTHPINTFEPLYIQFCHMLHIWLTFWSLEGWKNKLSVLLKGPGWTPGKPRLGDPDEIPDVKAPMPKYDPYVPLWCKLYLLWHLALLVFAYTELGVKGNMIPSNVVYGVIAYEIFSLSCLGSLMDGRHYVAWLELLRSVLYISVDYCYLPWTRLPTLEPLQQAAVLLAIRASFLASGIVWLVISVRSVSIKLHKKL